VKDGFPSSSQGGCNFPSGNSRPVPLNLTLLPGGSYRTSQGLWVIGWSVRDKIDNPPDPGWQATAHLYLWNRLLESNKESLFSCFIKVKLLYLRLKFHQKFLQHQTWLFQGLFFVTNIALQTIRFDEHQEVSNNCPDWLPPRFLQTIKYLNNSLRGWINFEPVQLYKNSIWSVFEIVTPSKAPASKNIPLVFFLSNKSIT